MLNPDRLMESKKTAQADGSSDDYANGNGDGNGGLRHHPGADKTRSIPTTLSPKVPSVKSARSPRFDGSNKLTQTPSDLPSRPKQGRGGKPKAHDSTAATSSLAISRNKHWRYISAFHGPWLQLPHEILETLVHSNFVSPRARSTDPGVLYDLIKIRRLVDDASDLAVRAQNGTASSALVGTDHGLPGSSLGLSGRGAWANAKLSPERRYRMRELATQKLAQAYRLDEVAASVATMQGTSVLDNIASLVLQRNPNNTDAKYVHFFHEKIPSRMMAESTSLATLNDIIAAEPGHAASYRTRALTRIFKDDLPGAVQDLTESLALCKLDAAKHKAGRNQLMTMHAVREEAEKRKTWSREWMQENRVHDDEQPKGIEMQVLFQRGNQYLALACRHIQSAIEGFRRAQRLSVAAAKASGGIGSETSHSVEAPSVAADAYKKALEARECIRKNAKRALRDYTTFLSRLDYAHAQLHNAEREDFGRDPIVDELAADDTIDATQVAAVVGRMRGTSSKRPQAHHMLTDMMVHEISSLVSSSPPADLPVFPSEQAELSAPSYEETLTYHPLLPDALHALLLAHCLLQTPPTALLRHANNVARLIRLADGYPFFLAARSPARADWSEILRKTGNWIGLTGSWDALCRVPAVSQQHQEPSQPKITAQPSALAGLEDLRDAVPKRSTSRLDLERRTSALSASTPQTHSPSELETSQQKRERIHRAAVLEALGDERVVDDETFQRSVEARERRAWQDLVEEAQAQRRGAAPVEGDASCTSRDAHADKPDTCNTLLREGEEGRPAASRVDVTSRPANDDLLQGVESKTTAADNDDPTSLQSDSTGSVPRRHADKSLDRTSSAHAAVAFTSSLPSARNDAPNIGSNYPKKTTPTAEGPSRQVPPKDEEYLIGTERAQTIARWMMEAPTDIVAVGGVGVPKSKKSKARKRPMASPAIALDTESCIGVS